MYELIFIIIAISIGLLVKYMFTQESQRPYPYHPAFAGLWEDLLNWGKVNPKAGLFANLMIFELHIYLGVSLINPTFGVYGMLFIIYLGMFGVWILLLSALNIAEATDGLFWKHHWSSNIIIME